MSVTWEQIHCKECGVINFVYLGNMADLTARDTEGFICYKCGEVHSFIEDDPCLTEVIGGDDPENYVRGLEVSF